MERKYKRIVTDVPCRSIQKKLPSGDSWVCAGQSYGEKHNLLKEERCARVHFDTLNSFFCAVSHIMQSSHAPAALAFILKRTARLGCDTINSDIIIEQFTRGWAISVVSAAFQLNASACAILSIRFVSWTVSWSCFEVQARCERVWCELRAAKWLLSRASSIQAYGSLRIRR